MRKKTLVIGFILAIMTLLIGQRYGAVWAGGNGVVQTESITVIQLIGPAIVDRAGKIRSMQTGDHLIRGETITTGDAARILLRTPSGIIFALDERGTATVDQLVINKDFSLRLIKGRMIVNGNNRTPITIRTNRTSSTFTEGSISLVNYDFLETVGILPIDNTVGVTIKNGKSFSTTGSMAIHETNPIEINPTPFHRDATSVKGFYDWFESNKSSF